VNEPQVSFLFKDPNSAGEMRPAGESAHYRYVIMPMRI
jgi:DNA polymerase III sliding clamp (beta) subunit (PCNA family)